MRGALKESQHVLLHNALFLGMLIVEKSAHMLGIAVGAQTATSSFNFLRSTSISFSLFFCFSEN